jgi:hypothetical protein
MCAIPLCLKSNENDDDDDDDNNNNNNNNNLTQVSTQYHLTLCTHLCERF